MELGIHLNYIAAEGKKGMLKVLLDTSILLLPFERSISVLEGVRQALCTEVEFVVLSTTLRELKQLARRGPKMAKVAEVATKLVSDYCKLVEAAEGMPPDEALIVKAKEIGAVVATNDKNLRRRLRAEGIPRVLITEDGRFLAEGFTL